MDLVMSPLLWPGRTQHSSGRPAVGVARKREQKLPTAVKPGRPPEVSASRAGRAITGRHWRPGEFAGTDTPKQTPILLLKLAGQTVGSCSRKVMPWPVVRKGLEHMRAAQWGCGSRVRRRLGSREGSRVEWRRTSSPTGCCSLISTSRRQQYFYGRLQNIRRPVNARNRSAPV